MIKCISDIEKSRMEHLVEFLNYHTKLYDEGHPKISDYEWDKVYFELQKLEGDTGYVLPDSPTHRIKYEAVTELKKVKHDHPMLSLAKTKDLEQIKSFIGNKEGIAMLKMDGLTCSLTYKNGKLIKAETRGDGNIGEDVTHNAWTIPSIPKILNIETDIVVDGEIICKNNDFELFKNDYKNSRNFASGSIRLLDNNECAKRKLTFVAWDCISPIAETLSAKLDILHDFGFIVVPYVNLNDYYHADKAELISYEDVIDDLKYESILFSYPIDGLVFKYDDCKTFELQGKTDHHFRGGMAFKFYDEEYDSQLIDIEWSMGRTGQITPIAIFKKINIDGTEISRASLSNISIMEKTLGKKPFIGQKIYVTKRNMIIPKIERAKDENDEWI